APGIEPGAVTKPSHGTPLRARGHAHSTSQPWLVHSFLHACPPPSGQSETPCPLGACASLQPPIERYPPERRHPRLACHPELWCQRDVGDVDAEAIQVLHFHAVGRDRVDEVVDEQAAFDVGGRPRPPGAAGCGGVVVLHATESPKAVLHIHRIDQEPAEADARAIAAVAAPFADAGGYREQAALAEVVEG